MKKIPMRWLILAVLFFSAVVNYIDRNVLSFVMIDDTFKKDMLDWAAHLPLTQDAQNTFKIQMGYVDAIFKACYAVGFILTGWLIDRFLLRKGFGISITLWSLAGVMAAFVGSIKGLAVARGLLAVGESGNMPAATKTIGEWFPQKERSLAFGFFTAAGNIGIILTAWFVPYLSLHYGWQFCFLITGLLGFLVLMSWLWIYYPLNNHLQLSESERTYIVSGQIAENPNIKISWKQLLGYRQTWAFVVGKFLTDPIFWIYLTWLPDFFNSNEALDQKLDLKNIGLPFLVIYLVTDMGAIFFGWLSSFFISKGWSVNAARKTTMLLAAL